MFDREVEEIEVEGEGDDTPYLTPTEYRAFKRHVEGLNKLITQVRQRYPEAQYYLACSLGATLNILSGDSHDGPEATACQERIIESLTLEHADGGDW